MSKENVAHSKRTDSPCPTCNRTFDTVSGMRQHHTKVHGTPLPNRICKACTAEFYDSNSERTYCEDCTPQHGSTNPNWNGGKETTTCIECGAEFTYYPSSKSGLYCSDCVAADSVSCMPTNSPTATVIINCVQCRTPVTVYEHKATQQTHIFCDRECYANWLSHRRRAEGRWTDDDNPNWRTGVDTSDHYGPGWSYARRRALERDAYSCQRCGADHDNLERNPDVHHIIPVREFDDPMEAHTLENVVCLCRSCHMAVERGDQTLAER